MKKSLLVLGIESSCDETGIGLVDTERGLLAHRVFSQIDLHAAYGGVVPELASRDHVRRIVPLIRETLAAGECELTALDAIGYTTGPGLAGALLVGAAVAESLGFALQIPAVPIHHLEGHLLSPMLSSDAPVFPFVALLVSGGHTQLMRVSGVGEYALLGESVDDAAGEAFDKTAKLLGLPYPGGPALSRLATQGVPGKFRLPRPMKHSGDLMFSFSGLKTAVLTATRRADFRPEQMADLAAEFQEVVVEVLCVKAREALKQTGLKQLVVAGGVGANARLRERLHQEVGRRGGKVYFPELEYCSDNGAMIAFACAMRLRASHQVERGEGAFAVRPRWPLAEIG
ncbi:MAG: tRNA (adenosine(37)-N6)-threonylcarbamoyltransferase complex transferase subunit TsaD [Candidatus Dactylopiibacterium carminicum]|uniref:tRNA N6-adenosine threonylcarbamoyltransferase n=1 Tax=Candidatus Dactylopiibacterium carminicum TaxID=857335 RepID=A0A272EXC8_9RHOO|nr:tRNA (adenosine(37)-N6)-threonylcarbamoyltransferase complex transferase subunit TsaD [Candidatus Dactylopiibacterium carminicum]KAF7600252.1 tRNA (adenosine(37)-N6)-threonylcarbamoyltransferase complex transferase subunit TsaD [Candidatus Dactylopiibacterium carminicum]PAS94696.1 MAG: tRNA (adenosine(37)-N6)-threonylcarbamoyltransferase complex transferase subunit TsaD [Candidatus Dactylopiibacterium carminicum]PAS96983.1 MAG: tRNA (adenosine(37)-N6)-threonylcarbamoyltransferase complex tran